MIYNHYAHVAGTEDDDEDGYAVPQLKSSSAGYLIRSKQEDIGNQKLYTDEVMWSPFGIVGMYLQYAE